MRKTRRGLCRKGNSRVRKGSRDARAEQATSQSKPGRLEMPPCANQHSPPTPNLSVDPGGVHRSPLFPRGSGHQLAVLGASGCSAPVPLWTVSGTGHTAWGWVSFSPFSWPGAPGRARPQACVVTLPPGATFSCICSSGKNSSIGSV